MEQLTTIGWTSISTAKSNPAPGLLAIWNLRDLMARWLQTDASFGAQDGQSSEQPAPVVYSDNLPGQLMHAFESLAVVASESMQHQSAAEVYRTFATLLGRMPPALRRETEGVVLRSLAGLGDHVLTKELDDSLSTLFAALEAAGHAQCAGAVDAASRQLRASTGRLNSRSTRTSASERASKT